ncbi:MAG TPA: hypothetical protein VGI30_13660 [Caulobacteraceae bacterium]|jgi:hypothetical protein
MNPDAAMMAGPESIARFIGTGEEAALAGVFAERDVAILENFAPHVFAGPEAVASWTRAMRTHLEGVSGLKHSFGPACDFARSGELTFFSLPTEWTGLSRGRRFRERGGWAFVLIARETGWRVRNYAWAVTEISAD